MIKTALVVGALIFVAGIFLTFAEQHLNFGTLAVSGAVLFAGGLIAQAITSRKDS